MSGERVLLAAAASAVPGLTGAEYVTSDTTPGVVYPRLERIEYPNKFGGIAYWNVVMVLPTDLADAERFVEANLTALRHAVAEHLYVTGVSLYRLDIPGVGLLPVASINGHRETDL